MNMQEEKGKEGIEMEMDKGMVDGQARDAERKATNAHTAQDMEQVDTVDDGLGEGADHSNMVNSNSDILMDELMKTVEQG
jgi:hypothetical protein